MTCPKCPPLDAVLGAAFHDTARPLCQRCDADEVDQRRTADEVAAIERRDALNAAAQDQLRADLHPQAHPPTCSCGPTRELLAAHIAGTPPACALHRPDRPLTDGAPALNSAALLNSLAATTGGTVNTNHTEDPR